MQESSRPDIVRVVLADDSNIIRKILREQLRDDSQIEVVGEAPTRGEIFDVLSESTPDVLVLDLHMLVGADSVAKLKHTYPEIVVLVMSALIGEESQNFAREIGVEHVLEKIELATTLAETIKAAVQHRKIRPSKAS